jgi:hypothetical protein
VVFNPSFLLTWLPFSVREFRVVCHLWNVFLFHTRPTTAIDYIQSLLSQKTELSGRVGRLKNALGESNDEEVRSATRFVACFRPTAS